VGSKEPGAKADTASAGEAGGVAPAAGLADPASVQYPPGYADCYSYYGSRLWSDSLQVQQHMVLQVRLLLLPSGTPAELCGTITLSFLTITCAGAFRLQWHTQDTVVCWSTDLSCCLQWLDVHEGFDIVSKTALATG